MQPRVDLAVCRRFVDLVRIALPPLPTGPGTGSARQANHRRNPQPHVGLPRGTATFAYMVGGWRCGSTFQQAATDEAEVGGRGQEVAVAAVDVAGAELLGAGEVQ